jgi:hypothetical protein
MNTTEMFNPTTGVGRRLAWFWDMIDISENMTRIEDWTETISNGLASRINVFVFGTLTLVAFALTWYFDLQSTITGMTVITDRVMPNLPVKVEKYSAIVVLAFTIMPTLLEIFTAGLAKYNVKIIQIMIIAMTIFDVLTDIPRAYELAMSFWPQMETMGLLGPIVFWFFYGLIQLMATIGFELGVVIFAYATLIFVAKSTKAASETTRVHAPRMSRPAHRPQQRVHTTPYTQDVATANDDVIIIDAM